MSISSNLLQRLRDSIKESATSSGQSGQVVLNPDGSNVGTTSLTGTPWSVDASAALEASTITKASAGKLGKFSGRIDSTATTGTYYILSFNSATVPADATANFISGFAPIKIQHTTGTDSRFDFDATANGIDYSTGIVICASTTEFTKTIITSNWLSLTVLYK